MKNSDFGAKAPKVKDDFKKNQPIAGSKIEADEIRERLNKPPQSTRNLTIGGSKEASSHQANRNSDITRLKQIETGLDRAGKHVQLKSRFNKTSKTRSRTRTRS